MEYLLSTIGLPAFSLKKAVAPLGAFVEHALDHFLPHSRNNYHPHILGHRSLALMSGLLVTVKIFTLGVLALGPVVPAFSSAITRANIISLTNLSRQEFSLPEVKENSLLDLAAQTKADDMLAKGYFAHNSPDGKTPWTFIVGAGYSYLMAGENLAVNFTEAENVETAWMNSPGHKANIVNKDFEEIGIGIAQGQYQEHSAIFVVQMFGTPIEQKVTLSNQSTKVAVLSPATPGLPDLPGHSAPTSPNLLPATAEPVAILSGQVELKNDVVRINAQISGPVSKAEADFGSEAVMLSPKQGGLWVGEILVTDLSQKNASVRLKAFGMQGQSAQLQLADFSDSTVENYNMSGTTPASTISFFGHNFNPKSFEYRFYLFFIAGILSCLVLAIAVKKHVQHLSLIANSSFVVIFATLLWWGG